MQKKLMVVFLCGLMAMLAGALQAANIGSTSVKAGWCDAARWVSGVAPAAGDGNEYWATNNFQSSVASVAFPCVLHIGAPAGSVLGNAGDLTPTIQIQVSKINWMFSDLKWHGGTLQENNGAGSTDVNVIQGNVALVGSQDHVLAVQTTTSKSGQLLQFNATLSGDEGSVLTLKRVNGAYKYAQAGAYGVIKMGGDSSQFNGAFATAGTTYYDTIFFTTDNPLGNPATLNAAALVLKEKAVLAFANGIKQSANRGIRIDGDEVYLMNWEGKNDDWTIESPITKGEGAAAKVCKDGPGTVTLDCAYSAGDIAVNAGTLVLAADSTFPLGQKLKVEAGAKVISYRSLTGFEITGEGAVERRMAPMVVTYEEGVTTPVQLGGDFDIESGLIQPIALSQPIALPFHETKRLHVVTIAAGARDFSESEFADGTAKTYGLPHTTLEISKEDGVQKVWIVAKPVVTTEESDQRQFFADRTIWSNGDFPQPGFDYLVRGIAQQQEDNIDVPAEFEGDSLTIAYRFYTKTRNYTVRDLTLWGGTGININITNAKFFGNIRVDGSATDDTPAYILPSKNNQVTLEAALCGSGTLWIKNNSDKDNEAGRVTFRGDNSAFTGKFLLDGQAGNATVSNVILNVLSAEGFGGAPATAKADAFRMSGPAVVHPLATMTLDTGLRGWTVSDNSKKVGGQILVDGGNMFTLKEALTLDGTLTKTGAGTLALGGAASGSGTLSVQGGALQPLTANCCQPFSVKMAEGTTLVLDLADEALRERGFLAADLQPSSENDTIGVRIENAASVAAGRGEFEVVLCTLPADTTDVSGSMVVTAKGYKCRSVTRVAVPDSDLVRYTVTLWKPGLALIFR